MTGMIRNTGFFAIFLQSAVKAVCCHNLTVRFKNIYSISVTHHYTPVAHRIDNLHAKTEKEKVLYSLRIQDFLLVRVRRFELPAS